MNLTAIDVILLLIPIIFLIIGCKKGLAKIITPIIKLLLSIFFTVLIAPDIVNAWSGPYFKSLLQSSISEYLTVNCPQITAAQSSAALPSLLKLAVGVFDIDLSAAGTTAGQTVISEVSVLISDPLGTFIANAVTYVVLFFVFVILLSIVLSLINVLFSEGPLKVVNKILGVVFMAVVSVFVCCLISTVTGMLAPAFVGGDVYVFFRDFDPLTLIFSI